MSKLSKAFLVGMLAFTVLSLSRPAAAEDDDAGLIGTWQVQISQVDCTTGVPLSPVPFSSLLTFNDGGTMVGDTTNPAFGPGQRGGDQGSWKRKGWHVYVSKMVTFIKYTTPPDPTTHNPGFTAGQQSIMQTITLKDANHWTSTAAIAFTDSTGAVYRQGCALASAQRF